MRSDETTKRRNDEGQGGTKRRNDEMTKGERVGA